MITKNKTAIDYVNMKSGSQFVDIFFDGTSRELKDRLQQSPLIDIDGADKYIDMFYDNGEVGERIHVMLNRNDIESIQFYEEDPENAAVTKPVVQLSDFTKQAIDEHAKKKEKAKVEEAGDDDDEWSCCDCGECDNYEDDEEFVNCICFDEDEGWEARLITFGTVMPRVTKTGILLLSEAEEKYLSEKVLDAVTIVSEAFFTVNEECQCENEVVLINAISDVTTDIVTRELRKVHTAMSSVGNVNLFKDTDAFAKAISKRVINELIFS